MTRRDLAVRFCDLGFTRGAEIGVEQGLFSETLCQCIPGLMLLAVDAWTVKPGYREHVTQEELDRFERKTRERLRPYGVNVWKGFSSDVARMCPDKSFDFVYIDADHAEAEVLADIRAWAPKVRSGGVVAGHDWNLESVKSAVMASAIEIHVTDERSPSWWFHRA